MSELEDPVATLLRLINSRIRVTKDNGEAAKLLASEAAFGRELLLREYDAQVTLSIDPVLGVQDQKLNLSGSKRRQVHFFKCMVHSMDKTAPGADLGRVMRNKVTEQIKAIIRENRTLPYETAYDFAGHLEQLYFTPGTPKNDEFEIMVAPVKVASLDGIAPFYRIKDTAENRESLRAAMAEYTNERLLTSAELDRDIQVFRQKIKGTILPILR